jgi:helix-turn-helix protein
MKLTEQQTIILFDIVKGILYSDIQQFAGYSKEQIMTLLNDIIKQQDNEVLVSEIKNIDFTDSDTKDHFWDDFEN